MREHAKKEALQILFWEPIEGRMGMRMRLDLRIMATVLLAGSCLTIVQVHCNNTDV
jgi:hypothetical protein